MIPIALAAAGLGLLLVGITRPGQSTPGSGAGSGSGKTPENPIAPADVNCRGLDSKLQKASSRQYNILVKMNRKYPEHFPDNWRCLTKGTSSGMERVFKDGMASLGPGLTNLDPESWQALVDAYGYTAEALAQKYGSEAAKKAVKALQNSAGNTIDSAKKAAKSISPF